MADGIVRTGTWRGGAIIRTVPAVTLSSGVGLDKSKLARLAKRVIGVFLAIIGLIFTLVGYQLVVSQTWDKATAIVQSCVAHSTHTGSTGTGHVSQDCKVTWRDDAGNHTATVIFGNKPVTNGQTQLVRVHGTQAVLPTPAWEGYVALGAGLLLIVGGVFLMMRSRRRPDPAHMGPAQIVPA
jgi:hypothetical protein